MKVIFLQDVRGIGKRYDVKDVSDGYARNFLIRNKLAEPATAAALKKINDLKAQNEREDEAHTKRLHEIAKKISDMGIEFELEADKSGSIFGSVNKEAILKALREHGVVTNDRAEVLIPNPIKKLGNYVVPIELKKGIKAELKIVVKAKQ